MNTRIMKVPRIFLHGGDYNPDQWLDRPDVLREDIRLMHLAGINAVSVGIFAWARLEPEEGRYDFAWLDEIVDRLRENGIGIVLATPSGARPAWMAQRYPEVLRCNERFERMHFGERHNHCLTSPVYREKVRQMDTELARHYAGRSPVLLWHIGNEFGGDCRCPLCTQAFREWLMDKYGTLEELNRRWWTGFWSQRYTEWSQIEPPSPMGEVSNPSMQLDWRRFETCQCASFIRMEREAVQAVMPEVPVTTNLMERFSDYDYFTLAREIDVVSWDSYPTWGSGDDLALAANVAMQHDLMRSLKRKPFFLMESTPSLVNWKPHNKLKRPGMHLLSSMQAVAHGSQSVMMFQWRKGRGGSEAFHGAVVSHDGRSDTRVFRDVAEVGQVLTNIQPVLDARNQAQVLILFDYENLWALEKVQAAQMGNMRYIDTVLLFYRSLWERGIAVDFADMENACPEKYRVVIAPMLFMFRGGIEEKLRRFTEQGGTLVTTFFSGIVDADHLTFLGDAPHGLTEVLGLRAEETDALYPGETNELVLDGQRLCLRELCELPREVTAEVVGRYGRDFYAGLPALTRNACGLGTAWYLAGKPDQEGVDAVMDRILAETDLPRADAGVEHRTGVVVTVRGDYLFVQNYSGEPQQVRINGPMWDLVGQRTVEGECRMPANGIMILKEERG